LREQFVFWDTERIRLFNFPQQAGRRLLALIDKAKQRIMSINIKRIIIKCIPSKQEELIIEKYRELKKSPIYFNSRKYLFKIQNKIIAKYFSYTLEKLENKLKEMGIVEGDTIFMHSSFNTLNGFKGGPQEIIDCILKVIGGSGNLLMVSMAYRGALYKYLRECQYFSVRDTVSHMGVITEIFRKKINVLRSLNPAHPILAYGPNAQWIVADHEKVLYSCGKGSPFEKILQLNAKALFFDTTFRSMTFIHYIEDLCREELSINLYHKDPIEVTVYDSNGNEIKVKTFGFSRNIENHRNFRQNLFKKLEKGLRKNTLIKTRRIGNTKLMLVELKQVVDCAQKIIKL
jgi:aminoglycoside 3-N-acetyltransferase